jgi:prepilin-type N-terminal cleavage/methylation domain-containing protein
MVYRAAMYRPAFTLLEVLVALVILGVGVLALSANAALVSRLIGDGSRMTQAATVATNRLEEFRGVACANAVSGTATTRGITERWSVASLGPRALEVQVSVTYPSRTRRAGGAARTQHFHGALPCAP